MKTHSLQFEIAGAENENTCRNGGARANREGLRFY